MSRVHTVAIVQARLGSQRLPGKVARQLAGKSLLAWVVGRARQCRRIDEVIVATSDRPLDRELSQLVPADVPVFFGSEQDVLGRFVAVLERFPADAVVRICADNPFLDPQLIDRLIEDAAAHRACDYLSYRLANGRPVILSPLGVFGEWCRADALRRVAAETTDPLDREHLTRYLYGHPERFNVRLLALPSGLERDDLRLTIDFEDDWRHAVEIHQALGPEPIDWPRIVDLVDRRPELGARMAALNRQHQK